MAFGDGLNDISMIREAGIGVAMQNAVEEVKSAADLITGSCEESGVAEVVERLLDDDLMVRKLMASTETC